MLPSSVNEFRINAQATICSDERVKDIIKMDLTSVGDVLVVTVDVALKLTSDIATVNFAIRR